MDGRWHRERPDMPGRLGRLAGGLGVRARSTRVVGTAVGTVALVLLVAVAVSVLGANGGGDRGPSGAGQAYPDTSAPQTPTAATSPTAAPTASPSPSETTKPTTPPPAGGDRGGDNGGGGDEPDPAPTAKKPSGSVSTPPTSFDVWRTGEGKYAANWEWPVSDGGLRISAYVLRECDGTLVLRVNDATYAIEFNYPYLECASVQAVNAAGEGEKAYGHVPNP